MEKYLFNTFISRLSASSTTLFASMRPPQHYDASLLLPLDASPGMPQAWHSLTSPMRHLTASSTLPCILDAPMVVLTQSISVSITTLVDCDQRMPDLTSLIITTTVICCFKILWLLWLISITTHAATDSHASKSRPESNAIRSIPGEAVIHTVRGTLHLFGLCTCIRGRTISTACVFLNTLWSNCFDYQGSVASIMILEINKQWYSSDIHDDIEEKQSS